VKDLERGGHPVEEVQLLLFGLKLRLQFIEAGQRDDDLVADHVNSACR